MAVWRGSSFLFKRAPLGGIWSQVTLTMDAALTGWNAVCSGVAVNGRWFLELASSHRNVLQLHILMLALHW